MCIALLTTAHPSYALIAIDNRDEYLLRPTSRPHWWSPSSSPTCSYTTPEPLILSSRDLHRSDKGTWLGITKTGLLAILTNYRESTTEPIAGKTSRGKITTEFLSSNPDVALDESVAHLVENVGVKGVGGFSLLCGQLNKDLSMQGIAVLSNRADEASDVPIIAKEVGGVWGLSNAVYSEDPSEEWPKVTVGKKLLSDLISNPQTATENQETLIKRLFDILDHDSLPRKDEDLTLAERIMLLRHSIFIPEIGDQGHREAMDEAIHKGQEKMNGARKLSQADQEAVRDLLAQENPPAQDPKTGEEDEAAATPFDVGMYGTQRQTVILVGRDGKVTFIERALWDEYGNKVERGQGDVREDFQIESWTKGAQHDG